ncbi:MAG: transposase [Planctomycetes bacterium]|nr:transposase [Planctomycetota bacterium]
MRRVDDGWARGDGRPSAAPRCSAAARIHPRGFLKRQERAARLARREVQADPRCHPSLARPCAAESAQRPRRTADEGVVYTRSQWATLIRFLDDGRIREISNNGCERALRATVIGRKNWQFFGSEEGAKAAAVMMSLAQSCREHGINPLLYLRDVLHRISTTPQSRIRELTPRGWKAVGDEIERHR